jgi:hypothetical protein
MRTWAISMLLLIVMIAAGANANSRARAQVAGSGAACSLLSATDIAKATGINVGAAEPGKAIPGTLGKCTWTAADGTKVILTLADAQHMKITVEAQQQTDGVAIAGIGTTAVGIESAGFTGGGYIISVLDAKGGFGVSILGKAGTRDRDIALAKLVESRR